MMEKAFFFNHFLTFGFLLVLIIWIIRKPDKIRKDNKFGVKNFIVRILIQVLY